MYESSSTKGQTRILQAAGTGRYLQSGHGIIDSAGGYQSLWVARSASNGKSRKKTDELITADRRGNDLADELAGHASQNHNDSMAMYPQETVKRNDEYRKLVHQIHKHMLRVTNRSRLLAQTQQRIACTAATRRKPNIATFTFHKQQDRTTRTIRFLHDFPPTRYNRHKDICQALIYYLQKMEIVDVNIADDENRLMPIELMIDFETSTGTQD